MKALRTRLDELTGTFLECLTSLGDLGKGIPPDSKVATPSDGIIWVDANASDMQITSGNQVVGDTIVLHSSSLEKVRERNSPGGENMRVLGNMLIVALYTEWDEVHRHRIADESKMEASDLLVPVFGDLRRFRIDIIHKKGISTKNGSAQTEELASIAKGDQIYIDVDRWIQAKRGIEVPPKEWTRVARFSKNQVSQCQRRDRPTPRSSGGMPSSY